MMYDRSINGPILLGELQVALHRESQVSTTSSHILILLIR